MRSSDPRADNRRILYLITNDISGRFLRGQLGFLVDHGFEVSVGTKRSDADVEFDDGVTVHEIEYVREPSPIADAKGLWDTITLIRAIRPAIVNASTPKAGLLGMLAARLCRVPKRVYVVRGLRFETMTGPRRRVFRWIERLTSACATDLVYNSPSLLAEAESERTVHRGRGVVVGAGSSNGVDVDRFAELPSRAEACRRLGLPPGDRMVGFVGRLTRDKGIIDLVEGFGDRDVRLLVVGDYEDGDPVPARIRSIIESSTGIEHVPWTDDTPAAYAAMDVLAFPSYREGLPNVPLEAQLCGVPVIAYAATGTRDAVVDGRTGLLVATGDRDALVEATMGLLADPARRGSMSVAATEWVRTTFEPRRIWRALAELYEPGVSG